MITKTHSIFVSFCIIFVAQVIPACAAPVCSTGYQPRGDVCISNRMIDFIACVESSGGNRKTVYDHIASVVKTGGNGEASGTASGVIIRGGGIVKIDKSAEEDLFRDTDSTFQDNAMNVCKSVLLDQDGSPKYDTANLSALAQQMMVAAAKFCYSNISTNALTRSPSVKNKLDRTLALQATARASHDAALDKAAEEANKRYLGDISPNLQTLIQSDIDATIYRHGGQDGFVKLGDQLKEMVIRTVSPQLMGSNGGVNNIVIHILSSDLD